MLSLPKTSIFIQEKKVLEVPDFQVFGSSIVAISGNNGEGKSTLAKALAGVDSVTVIGSISFQEEDITSLSIEERYSRGIRYVGQQLPTIEGVSILKILYGTLKNREQITILEYKKSLEEQYPELANNNVLTKQLRELSGGERKRVELISILASSPTLVILDEIDSGVDMETKKVFVQYVRKLRDSGCACVLISHDESFIDDLKVDATYIVSDGRLEKKHE